MEKLKLHLLANNTIKISQETKYVFLGIFLFSSNLNDFPIDFKT